MATAIESSVKTESPGDPYAWPAFEAVEHGVREARRAFGAARHATEELATDAVLKVQRHPLRTVSIAVGVGAVAGLFVGFGFGWFAWIRA